MPVILDGDFRRLTRALRNLGEAEFKKANKISGQILRDSAVERFRESKDPDGNTWKPLKSRNGKILVDSARLRNSIKYKASNNGVEVGTNTIYAATHQFGEKGRTIRAKNNRCLRFNINSQWYSKKVVKIKIPARPFLGINNDDIDEIKDALRQIVEEAADG